MDEASSVKWWWLGLVASVCVALYAFTGALQAALLHARPFAALAFAIWASVIVVSVVALAVCAKRLWKHYRNLS